MKNFDIPGLIQTIFAILTGILPTIELIKWLFYKITKKSPPTDSKVAQVIAKNINVTSIDNSINIDGNKREVIDDIDLANYKFKRRAVWSIVYILFTILFIYNICVVAQSTSAWNKLKETDFLNPDSITNSFHEFFILLLGSSSQTVIFSAKILIVILSFVILRSVLNKYIIDRLINIISSTLGIFSNLFLIKIFSSIDSKDIATSIINLYQSPTLNQFPKFFISVTLILQFGFFLVSLAQTSAIIYPDELDNYLLSVRFTRKVSKFIFAVFPLIFALYWEYALL